MSDTPKGQGIERANNFQRHYFPEIFAENVPEEDKDRGPFTRFQRTEVVKDAVPAGTAPIANDGFAAGDGPRAMENPDSAQHYAQGYDEGERAGVSAERGRLESIIKMLRLAMGEVERLKADLVRDAERQVVNLALAVTRKILNTEIQANPEAVAHVVRGALEHSVDAENLTVKVNPGDLHILKGLEFRSPELNGVLDKCNFESDDQVVAGGCVIQSELGEIDARISSQLRFIEERFMLLLDECESS